MKAHLDSINIMAGIDIGPRDVVGLGAAVLAILGAWEVLFGPASGSSPGDLTLNAKNIVAHLDANIAPAVMT